MKGVLQAKTTINFCKFIGINKKWFDKIPTNADFIKVCEDKLNSEEASNPFGNISKSTTTGKALLASKSKYKKIGGTVRHLDNFFGDAILTYTKGPFHSHFWGALAGPPHSYSAKHEFASFLGISIKDLAEMNENHYHFFLRVIGNEPYASFKFLAYFFADIHDQKKPLPKNVKSSVDINKVSRLENEYFQHSDLIIYYKQLGLSTSELFSIVYSNDKSWFHELATDDPSISPIKALAIANTPTEKRIPMGKYMLFYLPGLEGGEFLDLDISEFNEKLGDVEFDIISDEKS